MKRKGTKFNRRRVRARTEAVKKDGARWLLRHSVIFARVHEHSQRKKGKFFAMTGKLIRFFIDNVESKIASLKAKAVQVKQWLSGRWTGRPTAQLWPCLTWSIPRSGGMTMITPG